MSENLSQAHQIVAVVFKVLMSHRVPQKMRVQLEAGDGGILVAQGTEATIRQWSPFPNEDQSRLNRWADFEIGGKGLPGWKCQGNSSLLDPFPNRKVIEPLRSPIIRSWRSKLTKSLTLQPEYSMTEKIAAARMSARSSISRSSRRT